jgi:thiol-disulfide isomerase/thioredoxin
MKCMRLAVLWSALALVASAPGHAASAPRLHVHTIDQLAPLPVPYDTGADAGRDLAAAKRRAAASHKLLLVDLGGNWCLDCRILSGVMDQPEMKPFLQQHYEVVSIDVGRFDKNLDIPKHYGFGKLIGVPAVLIIDPATDRPVNRHSVFALADARSLTPQGLANWLARWTK